VLNVSQNMLVRKHCSLTVSLGWTTTTTMTRTTTMTTKILVADTCRMQTINLPPS